MNPVRKKLTQYAEGKDILFAGAIIVLMAAIFIRSCFFPMTSASGNVDSGFFPRMGSLVGFAVGVVLMIQSILKLKKARLVDAAKTAEQIAAETPEPYNWPLIAFSTAWLVVYMFLLQYLGMPLGSVLYLFVQITAMTSKENRNWKQFLIIAIVSVVMPLAVYFPFRYIFGIMLPMGIFR